MTRVPRVATIVIALSMLAGAGVAGADDDIADDPLTEVAPPASKRVYMVTDSVGLGAAGAMRRAFPADWQVTVDGDAGEFVETLEARLVGGRMASSPWVFGDHAVVAAGYNYPYWDPERFDRSIDSMVSTLERAGAKHVYWVTLREVEQQYVTPSAWRQVQPYYWYFPTVNDHLERALDRHPNLRLIDFAAHANRSGITYDAIHLNTTGSALYSGLARSAVDAATTSVTDESVTRIQVPDAAGVDAVALNLTTTDPRRGGFLTAFDCDQEQPTASNHNFSRDQVVAHSAIVPVSEAGEVCVFARTATNLIVDVTGRLTDGVASTTTRRLVDTRDRGSRQPAMKPLVVDVGDSSPVALSATTLDADGPGWTRVAPCDATDETSNLNMNDARPVPNVAVVEPDGAGTVCVTASVAAHLIVDRFVTFDAAGGVLPELPRRVYDSRETTGRLSADGVVRLDGDDLGIDDSTTGVMLNLTATAASGPGFFTAYPCALGRPDTSNLNFVPGESIANFAIIEPDDQGDVCIYTRSATDLIVDLMGTTTSGFAGGRPERLLDTRG